MKNVLKTGWVIPISLLLLFPAQLCMQLFVLFFAGLTGQLGLGYVLGCIIFGAAASLPLLLHIAFSKKLRLVWRVLLCVPVICLFAGLLFLSVLNGRPEI